MSAKGSHSEKKQDGPGRRILVVDDEPGFREILRACVEGRRCEVETARDAAEAMALLEQRHYDLVVTDIVMPGLSGLNLLEKVRTMCPGTAVIITTGFGTVETAVYAMKRGAADFILKPFRLDVIESRIREVLSLAV